VDPNLEQPDFRVLQKKGLLEVRSYAPHVIATTTVQGGFDQASRDGFRILAAYIFGKNQSKKQVSSAVPETTRAAAQSEKIAMTAPVNTVPEKGGWRISFMMPSQYTVETLPEPVDQRIAFEEVPRHCTAAIRFNGWTTTASMKKHEDILRRWMASQGLMPVGDALVSRYNDPFTLPWRRRNEIQIPVQTESCIGQPKRS
jgi:hypothetical protein